MKAKWTTKEGNKIDVSKMETSHIENCIKGLKAGKNFGTVKKEYLNDDEIAYIDDKSDYWIRRFTKELKTKSIKQMN